MLVTLRAVGYLPSLRHQMVLRMFKNLLETQTRKIGTDFRVPHFSIQKDHIHLIVEAQNGTLTRGIRSLIILFARRLNRLLRRDGRVWDDRYHRRDLSSPTSVRNALAYVLNNDLKHGLHRPSARGVYSSIDVYSSAGLFDGWCAPTMTINYAVAWPENTRPRTWALREGWMLGGSIDPRQRPGPREPLRSP